MKKLLAALVAVAFTLTAAAPVVAAERDKKSADKAKKDEKKDKKSDKKAAAPNASWDISKGKKQ